MKSFVVLLSILVLQFAVFSGCSKKSSDNSETTTFQGLRSLKPQESLDDFRDLASHFRTLYGPMEYKEKHLHFNFEDTVKAFEARVAEAKTDAEVFALFSEFVSLFQDGHVGIRFKYNDQNLNAYYVPLFVTPIEDRVIVDNVGDELKNTNIAVGDEVLLVDGKEPMSYLGTILKYNTWATRESNKHNIFRLFNRAPYMLEILPQSDTVEVKFKKADGTEYTERLVWRIKSSTADENRFAVGPKHGLNLQFAGAYDLNEQANSSLRSMAQPTPFFATPQVAKKTGWQIVTADANHRKKFGLKDTDKTDIFAAIYRSNGKVILLVRSYTFAHEDLSNETYMNAYRAILDQWQDFADVLVLDQTHNGGGSYCEDFARLFIQKESPSFVQAFNTDRKWITDLKITWPAEILNDGSSKPNDELVLAYKATGEAIEKAYDAGASLTVPLPLMSTNNHILPDKYFTWKKPMIVLIDELAGSCADAFPMLIKASGRSQLFGATTMGLGGNVESFKLKNTQASLRLTRGLFTSYRADGNYQDSDFIENNGVTPDIAYKHTVDDYRAGFVNYVETFTKAALDQIK